MRPAWLYWAHYLRGKWKMDRGWERLRQRGGSETGYLSRPGHFERGDREREGSMCEAIVYRCLEPARSPVKCWVMGCVFTRKEVWNSECNSFNWMAWMVSFVDEYLIWSWSQELDPLLSLHLCFPPAATLRTCDRPLSIPIGIHPLPALQTHLTKHLGTLFK